MTTAIDSTDIDRYLDTPLIAFKLTLFIAWEFRTEKGFEGGELVYENKAHPVFERTCAGSRDPGPARR
jgi:hypothetical protein